VAPAGFDSTEAVALPPGANDRGSVVAAYVVLRAGVSPGQRKVEELQNFAKNLAAP
jgi:acyl-coenzyme A synthetase/AMP-(fatty) acid ligase